MNSPGNRGIQRLLAGEPASQFRIVPNQRKRLFKLRVMGILAARAVSVENKLGFFSVHITGIRSGEDSCEHGSTHSVAQRGRPGDREGRPYFARAVT